MDRDEVMSEKMLEGANLNVEPEDNTLNIEKNNDIENNICLSTNNENTQHGVKEANHFSNVYEVTTIDTVTQNTINKSNQFANTYEVTTDNDAVQNIVNKGNQLVNSCEIIVMDDVEIEQNCNRKDNTNQEQQKSDVSADIPQNEMPIDSSIKDSLVNASTRKKDIDICILNETSTQLVQKDKISSLFTIAVDYGNSDSETEDNFDQTNCKTNPSEPSKEVHLQTYRESKESSSSDQSDSEEDSSSSSDSSIEVDSNNSDSDNSSNKKNKGNNIKPSKNNEIKSELDDLPPIEDLKISVPEVLCDPLGKVAWMVEQLVVVKPNPEKPTLNLDTVLFVDKGQRALGKIFDVFGQVNEPHYCVRFNSSNHIKECDVKVGMTVYYCPNTQYTSLVFLHELMKIKGIDASADDPPEFSDDEEERLYYEQLKAKQANSAGQMDVPFKRKKPNSGWQSNHPWNRNMQNQRQGVYPRAGRTFPSMQIENVTQNLWSQPYPNCSEQFGYGVYPLPSMDYMNQNFYHTPNYYNENTITPPLLSPRIPFTVPPRVSTGYTPFSNHTNPSMDSRLSNPSTDPRFPNANIPWLPQMPQVPIRMRMPWVSIPAPPPPPPLPPPAPPSSTSSLDK